MARKLLSVGQRVNGKRGKFKGTVVGGPLVVSHFRGPVYVIDIDGGRREMVRECEFWGVWPPTKEGD